MECTFMGSKALHTAELRGGQVSLTQVNAEGKEREIPSGKTDPSSRQFPRAEGKIYMTEVPR